MSQEATPKSIDLAVPGPILVTGGSSGIGRAVVELLRSAGAPTAFTYRSGQEAAEEIAENTGAVAFAFDLADRERPATLIEEVEERLGGLYGLVNNAGVPQKGGLLAMTSDTQWVDVLDRNLGGTFRCCRAALRSMIRRRKGSLVNVASLSALQGVAGVSAYAASKGAILSMNRSLAREMGGRGIRVNAVVPGYVETAMTADLPQKAIDSLRANECLERGTKAEDVAHAVVFLLSERALAMTGQTLVIDAGASV